MYGCNVFSQRLQILAALDVHTARHIVEQCLKGDLIRGRTVILVVSISTFPECRRVATYSLVLQTHNVAMVSPVADFLVDMGSDGRILSQGSLSSALSQDTKLAKEVEEEQQVLEKAEQEVDDPSEKAPQVKQNAGKLVVAEEMEEGHVGWDAGAYMRKPRVLLFLNKVVTVKLFLANVSARPVLFWIVCISVFVAKHLISNIQASFSP